MIRASKWLPTPEATTGELFCYPHGMFGGKNKQCSICWHPSIAARKAVDDALAQGITVREVARLSNGAFSKSAVQRHRKHAMKSALRDAKDPFDPETDSVWIRWENVPKAVAHHHHTDLRLQSGPDPDKQKPDGNDYEIVVEFSSITKREPEPEPLPDDDFLTDDET